MSQNNQGNQLIGWKYRTELVSETLNSFFASYSSPGLVTRPKITTSGTTITVYPFSALVEPSNNETVFTPNYTEYGNRVSGKLVKVTTTEVVQIDLSQYTLGNQGEYSGWCALVLYYTHETDGEWYADIVPASYGCDYPAGSDENWDVNHLTGTGAGQKRGIVIATIMYGVPSFGDSYMSVTTQGADISDLLLTSEGFDPNMWVTIQSPRRWEGEYAYLEVRKHNEEFSGYLATMGHIVRKDSPMTTFMVHIDARTTSGLYDGIRYIHLEYDDNDIDLSNTLSTNMPGIFAVLEPNTGWSSVKRPFNQLRIYPCNYTSPVWYVDGTTLYLK